MIYQALINSDGTENTAAVRVYLRLADLDSLSEAEATRASIEWYRISYCNADGDMKHRYIPASQEYDGE